MFRWLLALLGTLLCLDTGVMLFRSNANLGILLPGIMGLPLLLLGLFYPQFCALFALPFGRFLPGLLIALYACAALFFSLTSLLLYTQGHRQAEPGADALVVLGCAIHGERLTLTLARRLNTAILYLEQNPDTVCFVAGGQGSGEDIPEALAMRRYLVGRGIAEERIVMEDRSQSTQENFQFSAPLIRERCGENARIVYVTTYFHVYRAGRVAAAQGINAQGLGAPGLWYITPNDYLRECVAVAVYKLRGWI